MLLWLSPPLLVEFVAGLKAPDVFTSFAGLRFRLFCKSFSTCFANSALKSSSNRIVFLARLECGRSVRTDDFVSDFVSDFVCDLLVTRWGEARLTSRLQLNVEQPASQVTSSCVKLDKQLATACRTSLSIS